MTSPAPWLAHGTVTCPSGRLIIVDPTSFDIGPPRDGFCAVEGLPRTSTLQLVGRRCADDADRVEAIRVVASRAHVRQRRPVGGVVAPGAMLLVADEAALAHWVGDRTLDGLADYVIWGPGAGPVAQHFGLPPLGDGSFGVRDEPESIVVAQVMAVEAVRQKDPERFASDFRPHSHRYQLLRAMWELQQGYGTITLAGAPVCGFFTSWGPGACLISTEHAEDGGLCGVWIQLAQAG